MKRTLVVILAVLLLIAVVPTVVFAKGNVASDPYSVDVPISGWYAGTPGPSGSPDSPGDVGTLAEGDPPPEQTNFYITLSVPYVDQTLYPGVNMETADLSVKDAGCALCSALVVFESYGAYYYDPLHPALSPVEVFNSEMGDNACGFNWTWSPSASHGHATFDGVFYYSQWSLLSALWDNKAPIVYMTKGTSTHFVTVYSIQGDWKNPNNYYIRDSWNNRFQTLGQYINDGWTLQNMRTFTRW